VFRLFPFWFGIATLSPKNKVEELFGTVEGFFPISDRSKTIWASSGVAAVSFAKWPPSFGFLANGGEPFFEEEFLSAMQGHSLPFLSAVLDCAGFLPFKAIYFLIRISFPSFLPFFFFLCYVDWLLVSFIRGSANPSSCTNGVCVSLAFFFFHVFFGNAFLPAAIGVPSIDLQVIPCFFLPDFAIFSSPASPTFGA